MDTYMRQTSMSRLTGPVPVGNLQGFSARLGASARVCTALLIAFHHSITARV